MNLFVWLSILLFISISLGVWFGLVCIAGEMCSDQ